MTGRALLLLAALLNGSPALKAGSPVAPGDITATDNHTRMTRILDIDELRRGADGDPDLPYAASYDEAQASSVTLAGVTSRRLELAAGEYDLKLNEQECFDSGAKSPNAHNFL